MPQTPQEPLVKIGTKLTIKGNTGHVVGISSQGVVVWFDKWSKALEVARDVIECIVLA